MDTDNIVAAEAVLAATSDVTPAPVAMANAAIAQARALLSIAKTVSRMLTLIEEDIAAESASRD